MHVVSILLYLVLNFDVNVTCFLSETYYESDNFFLATANQRTGIRLQPADSVECLVIAQIKPNGNE